MIKTVDESGVDCWIMDAKEYSDVQLAFSDSVAEIKEDKTIVIKIMFPD
jgi:hypothetical protein